MKFKLKGLYVITDRKLNTRNSFIDSVESAIKGGANIVQLREKNRSEKEIMDIGRKLLEITKKYNVPLIINDSPEIAKEINADGVHLGVDDADISYARKLLGDESIIGISCYGDLERGIDAEKMGADYVAFGTPFKTPTKPDRNPTPFSTLAKASKLINKIPIFAIGGIFPENAMDVIKTGVDGIAVITTVFKSDNPEKAASKLASLFDY